MMAKGVGMELNFGMMGGAPLDASKQTRFRIALLGDFSGRAARGEVEIGEGLAARRPIKLDIDTLEKDQGLCHRPDPAHRQGWRRDRGQPGFDRRSASG
jgi:hypothetical protein